MRIKHGQEIYTHEEMHYELTRPNTPTSMRYTVEAWSPIYQDFPYDSDGWEDTYEQARFFANRWMNRFPVHYAIVIRGPHGAEIYRELTDQTEEGES